VLQIATGKLFTRPVYRENQLRGILYTNAIIASEESIQTTVGKLLSSSSFSMRPQALVYELTEKIETEAGGPPVFVSSLIEPYIQDFSVIASFALNCTCVPDIDIARRLTGGQPGLATKVAPNKLVRRFFDNEVWCKPEEIQFFVDFTSKLIGLHRATFLGVMRALRTYINGMHRIADDLEIAYTLLVASVESLAQDFDGHQADWDSLDEKKRTAIDGALEGADGMVAQKVRQALLEMEHVALARRFREFSAAHTTAAYFRSDLGLQDRTLGRSELAEVLSAAYRSRSNYVHQLQRLPQILTLGHGAGETAIVGRANHLTLQGLSRLMREVIIEFVMRQPKVEQEPYDYSLERSGVMQVRMAPQYWVGGVQGDIRALGRDKLEGFLEQLASFLLKEPQAAITDLRPVLALAIEFVPNLERRLRRPYLALHVLFNGFVGPNEKAPTPAAVKTLIETELSESCSEALIAHALFGQEIGWPLDAHREALTTYQQRRSAKSGLRFPRLFESALILDLAERYRSAGDMDRCRAMVAVAVEEHPGHVGLLQLEEQLKSDVAINWRAILLPITESIQ
jgi:hypothetical protein